MQAKSRLMGRTARLRTARGHGAAVLLFAMLAATPLSAQLVDLNVQPASPACDASVFHTDSFDTTANIDETIAALTTPVGAQVFWQLTPISDPMLATCTATAPGGFTNALSCNNGVDIALPVGATAAASVASTLPVTVTIDPIAGGETAGTVAFDLVAALADGTKDCHQIYKVVRNTPKKVFDLIFVLDRSGSMGAASGGGTRWTALRTGLETFKPFIETSAGAPTPAGSKFGVTFFHSVVDAATTALGNVLTGTAPSADFANLITMVGAQEPNGATAMGLGLKDALAKLTAPDHTKVVVLFTDGEQNVDPSVALNGQGFTNPTSPIIAANKVKICTIGIGSPSGTYLSTLQNLAANNGCSMLITDNGTSFTGDGVVPSDIGATFTNTIGAALAGNSPQPVASYAGPMVADPAAPVPVVLPTFDINQDTDNVMLSFTFSQKFETPQLLELVAGMTITRNGTPVLGEFAPMISGNFSDVVTLIARKDKGQAGNLAGNFTGDLSGTYEITLTLPRGFKSNLEYRLGVFTEDRNIETPRTLTPPITIVGQTLDVGVNLNYLTQGVEGATVVVRAFVPGADMGEVLSQGKPVPLSNTNDATNAGVLKYDQLAANDPAFLAQLALSPNAITMTDAGDGLYTGSFTVPDTVGVVQLVYDVAADSKIFGKVQRHWTESVYAGFNQIDMTKSGLSWRLDEAGLILTFTPVRPPSGKKVGPGNGGAFNFGDTKVVRIDDLQNGTYAFTLAIRDPKTPIKVSLFDKEIYNGPAGWGKKSPRSVFDMARESPWWLAILVLLIVLLVMLVRRRARP
jgi:von Willebrand factor type A domain